MTKRADVHTTPNADGSGWVNSVGGQSTGVNHRTQGTAIDAGRRIAVTHESEHFIHGRNGQIRERNTYHEDPFPPKG
jgi:hypothetical protein